MRDRPHALNHRRFPRPQAHDSHVAIGTEDGMNGRRGTWWRSAALMMTIAVGTGTAGAQTIMTPKDDGAVLRARLAPVMDPPGRAMPADVAGLDAMVQARSFIPLGNRLMAPKDLAAIDLDLNWMQARLFEGAGFFVAYSYMRALWALGTHVPADQGEGLKQNAAAMFLYTLSLASVDGSRCGDVTAPGHRQDQLFRQDADVLAYLRGLPPPRRAQVGTIAVSIESATAGVRRDDPVLCSGGMEEMEAGLKGNGKAPLRQVPNAPGVAGKTYAVPPSPAYRPRYVADAVAEPKRVAARQALPTMLTRLLAAPGGGGTAPP
ncbi:hypothetical protein [Sphingomonas beigongshangi]|uniref:hypothetical protein n=1 Tax=Sphingomonas beigongshangi TaxID=2782540 RepID=UPI00193BD545|nr:hypothetical protein [Sphingomonas beigongshangi]